jgi:hypothetical protein
MQQQFEARYRSLNLGKAETKFGTFEELLNIAAEPMRPIVRRLRGIIQKIDPKAFEVVRLGERSATYGVGPSKMTEAYAYILPHAKWVNLGFYKGADLDDPDGLLEGTGAKLRHIKVHSLEDADRPDLHAMIRAAFIERKNTLRK